MSKKICPQCGREYDVAQKFCPEDGATLRAPSGTNDLVGQVIADRYHVISKLGEGGMGQVYLAEHVRMKRKSAVKVMSPGMINDPDAVSRFNREASNASQINHPHVAAIYDFGETPEGLIYLAMEFVDGVPLSKLIEQHRALPAPKAAEITRQASEALATAHALGIVHRDLKPDNIMIARNLDGSDCVKVVDFGIAKATRGGSDGQKVTRTGFVVGTPEYMSPEQLAGDTVDGRSDIYSLALVAFNMFTGQLPFPSKTSQEAMIMRLTDRPRTLAEMKDDVPWPDALQAVMDRALSRDANERYSDARQFGRDLVKALEGMPALTAEQLGTQMLTAQSLAKRVSSPNAPVDVAKGAPTMAAPAGFGLPKNASGMAPTPRSAPTVSTQASRAPAAATPAAAPRPSGHRTGFLAGIGVAVVALAGAAYLVAGRDEAPAAAGPAVPATIASATPDAGAPSTSAPAADSSTSAPPAAAPPATSVATPEPQPTAPPATTRPAVTSTRPAATARSTAGTASTGGATTARTTTPTRESLPPAPVATAPQPVVSTPQPASPPAAPAAAAAAAFDAEAATRDIRAVLDRFAAAFETRRIDEVRRIAPGMSTEFARRWQTLLEERSVTEFTARVIRVSPPEFDVPAAEVPFAMKLDYKVGGQRQSPEIQYTAHFRREGDRWRMQTVTGR